MTNNLSLNPIYQTMSPSDASSEFPTRTEELNIFGNDVFKKENWNDAKHILPYQFEKWIENSVSHSNALLTIQ